MMLSEMILWDKLPLYRATDLLRNAFSELAYDRRDQSLGPMGFKMLGIYHDTLLALESRVAAMSDQEARRHALLTDVLKAQKADEAAAFYYAGARKHSVRQDLWQ
jgi:hypothetical protein